MGTLEDIVEEAKAEVGLLVTEQNASLYIGFLQRQQKRFHYDLEYMPPGRRFVEPMYRTLLKDKLLLFSYVMRQQTVKGKFHEETLVDSPEKLRLLKAQPHYAAHDSKLSSLYERRRTAREYLSKDLPTYTEIFDQVGSDSEVVKLWGKRLRYGEVMKRDPKNSMRG